MRNFKQADMMGIHTHMTKQNNIANKAEQIYS